jgi:hypothetical protein
MTPPTNANAPNNPPVITPPEPELEDNEEVEELEFVFDVVTVTFDGV